jgi:hypothetical protein
MRNVMWGILFFSFFVLTACAPKNGVNPSVSSTNNSNSPVIPEIKLFDVSITADNSQSTEVTVKVDLTAPNDGKFESSLIITTPNLKTPMLLSFGNNFPFQKLFIFTGWKNNSLSGSSKDLEGKILTPASNPVSVSGLFTAPQTTYDFTLFIRDSATHTQLFQKVIKSITIK